MAPQRLNQQHQYIVAGQTFTFLGNISANSNTITPTSLGYISGLAGNAETRLASLETKTTNITYTSPDTIINSNVQVNGLIKTSTTALTYTSTAIGYTTSVSNSTDFTIVASAYVFSNTSTLTLGIGVWLLSGTVQLYNPSTATITRFVQFIYTSPKKTFPNLARNLHSNFPFLS
uniref:Uncharacterized protein n=1 Tax=Chromulina nebulosa TaxID=96789 RepID=A0A7S0SY06_9STRA|mmetsp:Transcript_4090/g.3679  ORF Transcript_4090/g.3679 Transcript_4090/m.3679 type:complete len:175 (+) Transcript_4090:259-783(+)